MADLKARFEKAVAESKSLPEKPDNMTLLKIYALYKQASAGDVEGKRPGFSDMVGRAKWDAWNEVKGKSGDEAMQDVQAWMQRGDRIGQRLRRQFTCPRGLDAGSQPTAEDIHRAVDEGSCCRDPGGGDVRQIHEQLLGRKQVAVHQRDPGFPQSQQRRSLRLRIGE